MLQPFKRWGSLLAQDELLTAHAYDLLPHQESPRVLIRGVIQESAPPGERHNQIVEAFNACLAAWASSGQHGRSGNTTSFVVANDPDTVRKPDSFFVQTARVPQDGESHSLWMIAPDVAVEVVAPYETAEDVYEQVRDYLAAGTALVWIIYPRAQVVAAHTPDGTIHTYQNDAVLQAPTSMPGFACTVAALFGEA